VAKVTKSKAVKQRFEGTKRRQFTPEQRAEILAAAKVGKLTGKQVAEKFGISQVTFYLWKSKAGLGRKPGARRIPRSPAAGIELSVREAVRARIREAIPGIVRAEVGIYLDSVLGTRGKRRSLKA